MASSPSRSSAVPTRTVTIRGSDHLAHTTDFEQAKDWLRTRTPRGFLVVDTIQGSIEAKDHDGHLDAGVLHALERRAKELITLANEGYAILVVSQTNDRNSKQPPTLGALKGASALEQMTWTVVGYGTARKTAADTRALVLRKLRRPTAKEWPIDSRLLIKTDGQDGLSEAGTGAAPRDEPKPAASPAERVARARAEHPGASLRELARLSKVSKSHVANLLKVSTQVSTVDSSGQSSGQHESPAATRT